MKGKSNMKRQGNGTMDSIERRKRRNVVTGKRKMRFRCCGKYVNKEERNTRTKAVKEIEDNEAPGTKINTEERKIKKVH